MESKCKNGWERFNRFRILRNAIERMLNYKKIGDYRTPKDSRVAGFKRARMGRWRGLHFNHFHLILIHQLIA